MLTRLVVLPHPNRRMQHLHHAPPGGRAGGVTAVQLTPPLPGPQVQGVLRRVVVAWRVSALS